MNNTYPAGIWGLQCPVNNFTAWNGFRKWGAYEPANNNEKEQAT